MTHVHHRMVDLALAGMTRQAIAQELDYSPEGVGIVLNSPLVQAELARRRALADKDQTTKLTSHLQKAREILEEAAVPAAQTMVELLDNQDPNIRRLTAKDIFSQVYGTEGVVKTQITNISVEQMNLLIETMGQVKRLSPSLAQPTVSESSPSQTSGEAA